MNVLVHVQHIYTPHEMNETETKARTSTSHIIYVLIPSILSTKKLYSIFFSLYTLNISIVNDHRHFKDKIKAKI